MIKSTFKRIFLIEKKAVTLEDLSGFPTGFDFLILKSMYQIRQKMIIDEKALSLLDPNYLSHLYFLFQFYSYLLFGINSFLSRIKKS